MSNKAELRADLQKAMTIALDVARDAGQQLTDEELRAVIVKETYAIASEIVGRDVTGMGTLDESKIASLMRYGRAVEKATIDPKDYEIARTQLAAAQAAKAELAEALRHLLHNIKATGKRLDLGLAVVAAESALKRNGCEAING